MKNHLRENDIFSLMTFGAETIYLRPNLIVNRFRGMNRAPQCFSGFLLAITPLEIKANICEKGHFLKN